MYGKSFKAAHRANGSLVLILVVLMSSLLLPVSLNQTVSAGSGNVSYFETNGIDQPLNGIDYPSSVYFAASNSTYVVWQGTTDFLPYIKAFNHTTNVWGASYKVANSNPVAPDGHGAPSMAITPDGKIHVFFGSHISAQKYSRGSIADLSAWTAMADVVGSAATYPHAVTLGSVLYLIYRVNAACSGTWAVKKSADSGATWNLGDTFLTMPAYIGGVQASGTDSILFQAVHVDSCAAGEHRADSYVAYWFPPASAVVCKKVGGDVFTFVADLTYMNTNCRVDTAAVTNFGTAHAFSAVGFGTTPVYAIYLVGDAFPTGNWRYHFAKWTNAAGWVVSTISYNDNFQDYGDFRAISDTSLEAYLVSNGTGGGPLSTNEGGNIDRWIYSAGTWAKAETILTEATSGDSLTAPMVPANAKDIRVVFDQRRVSTSDANAKLYAWGVGGFFGIRILAPACGINGSLPGLSSLLLVVVGVGLLLLAVGAFIMAKRKEVGDIRYYVTVVVGFMVVLVVTGVFTGALSGC